MGAVDRLGLDTAAHSSQVEESDCRAIRNAAVFVAAVTGCGCHGIENVCISVVGTGFGFHVTESAAVSVEAVTGCDCHAIVNAVVSAEVMGCDYHTTESAAVSEAAVTGCGCSSGCSCGHEVVARRHPQTLDHACASGVLQTVSCFLVALSPSRQLLKSSRLSLSKPIFDAWKKT